MRYLFSLFLVLLVGGPAVLHAQDSLPDLLAVDSAFVNGEYEKAELLALRALQNPALPRDARARLNLTTGYALIMLGRESEARVYFSHALEAVPDLVLDPVQVSPRFRMVFDEVKAGREVSTVSTVRTGRSRLWNLLLPGSGQWLEGHRTRGLVIFGAQVAADAALIWQLSALHDSRGDYLAESDPARLPSAYTRFNKDYRTAIGLGTLAGLVYLAAQTDLIFLRPHTPAGTQVSFGPGRGLQTMTLVLRW